MMHLYNSILFSIESFDFRPINQYIFFSCCLSCFRFVTMCFFYVSCLFRYKSRYLTSLACGICALLIKTGEYILCIGESYLCGFCLINFYPSHFLSHLSMLFRLSWSILQAIIGFWWTAKTAISSAKIVTSFWIGMSAV